MPNQGGTAKRYPSPLRMFAGVKGFLIYEETVPELKLIFLFVDVKIIMIRR